MSAPTLIDTLGLSVKLAQRWTAVTPEMELAWNPRDAKGVVKAVEQWLGYVSEHRFPVMAYCPSIGHARQYLERVPVEPQGYSMLDDDNYGRYDVEDVVYHILHLGYCVELELFEEVEPVLQSFRDRWGFQCVAPLPRIANWVEDQLHRAEAEGQRVRTLWQVFATEELPSATDAEGADAEASDEVEQEWPGPGEFPHDVTGWRGLLHLLRYYLQDTPYDLLNWPANAPDGYEQFWEDHSCDWLDAPAVERLTSQYALIESYMEPARALFAWTEKSHANLHRVTAVLQQAAAAVRDAGWSSWESDWGKMNWLLQEDAANDGELPEWEDEWESQETEDDWALPEADDDSELPETVDDSESQETEDEWELPEWGFQEVMADE